MPGTITCAVSDGIANVRLRRPGALNALTLTMLTQLARTARDLRSDRSLRAVIITGDGDAFCAGLDIAAALRQPRRVATMMLPRPLLGTNAFQEACWAWRRLPVPVIAAVHGHCLGAGLQLALSADFRYSTADAGWSVMEARWGLVPDMTGIHTLSQLVGLDTAKRLTMTAATIDGREAHRLGLVTGIADDPYAAATGIAAAIAARSPDAVAASKRLFERAGSSAARRTFAHERFAQLRLLATRNTAIARAAAIKRDIPQFRPRARR